MVSSLSGYGTYRELPNGPPGPMILGETSRESPRQVVERCIVTGKLVSSKKQSHHAISRDSRFLWLSNL